ncbi:hypothetical protein POM88_047488 [Heracleum sosnowskyi]|uniref:Myb/SANT-like domain-containing protein n=1 Tax=Heracleum sosnowskyi TaxID=360622 RepID=A0AAD8GS94_9APIA|nr:hypothetical protein POM88_047488 [Heracleum sosnowskyi]
MLNQQYEGHGIDGTFTSQAYVNMVAEMRQKTNIELNKAHLKNRLKTLKDHFAQCYDLLRGVKPDAIKWKTKPILNYNELEELFAKDRVTCAGNTVNLESFNNDDDIQFVAVTPSSHEASNSASEVKGKKRKYEEEEDINKGKKKKCEEEEDINKKIMNSLKNIANAIREGHAILKENARAMFGCPVQMRKKILEELMNKQG